MKELICIVCPNSCLLTINDNNEVSGAKCPRGKKFAIEEMTAPKRTVCTTVATVFADYPVLPVRTSDEIPKDKIFQLMELVKGFKLEKRVARGEILIKNILNLGVDLISSSNMLYNYNIGK
ncbi:MAG: DUF1667 domain-containing protein [Clostridia bacterium]